MLRSLFASLVFLLLTLPAQAQNCGPLCEATFWVSASPADIQAQIIMLNGTEGGVNQAGVPLQLAISLGKPESIQALISAGADVNIAPASSNIPPLSHVINQPIPALVPLFLDAGAEVDAVDSHGNSALHYAAASLQQPQTLTRLIAAGADVNAQNAAGDTPLHLVADIAANTEETYIIIANIAILKNAGADFNIQNNKGQTPLHIAAGGYNPTLVTQLLAAGSDGSLLSADGQTPFAVAATYLVFAVENPAVSAALEAAQ